MVARGELHEWDAEWIERLQPQNQLAAAQKCVENAMVLWPMENPKSCVHTTGRVHSFGL